jgi:hypothetical protein
VHAPTVMPPSPTAAAQRFTEPERTSPAAKIPGQLVSNGSGKRLMPFHTGASTTTWPVLMKPFSSRSISGGSQAVHGFAPGGLLCALKAGLRLSVLISSVNPELARGYCKDSSRRVTA